jgi:hypothetical protein
MHNILLSLLQQLLLLSLLLIRGIVSTPIHQNDKNMNNISFPDDVNDDYNKESCKLMDGFAIFVQISLCFTALLTLIFKRSKESPQRPYQIWYLTDITFIFTHYISNV